MYLLDANIFLEILLEQEKRNECKQFLNQNSDSIHLSDFSFHSIGVILFRQHKDDIYLKFVADVLPNIRILTLPLDRYKEIVTIINSMELDFDDAYQYLIAQDSNLTVVTLDNDFKKAEKIKVKFL